MTFGLSLTCLSEPAFLGIKAAGAPVAVGGVKILFF